VIELEDSTVAMLHRQLLLAQIVVNPRIRTSLTRRDPAWPLPRSPGAGTWHAIVMSMQLTRVPRCGMSTKPSSASRPAPPTLEARHAPALAGASLRIIRPA
jgi:hypothetical protein